MDKMLSMKSINRIFYSLITILLISLSSCERESVFPDEAFEDKPPVDDTPFADDGTGLEMKLNYVEQKQYNDVQDLSFNDTITILKTAPVSGQHL